MVADVSEGPTLWGSLCWGTFYCTEARGDELWKAQKLNANPTREDRYLWYILIVSVIDGVYCQSHSLPEPIDTNCNNVVAILATGGIVSDMDRNPYPKTLPP